MTAATGITVIICLVASISLVVSEFYKWPVRRAVFKIMASTAFVMIALQLGATTTTYGRVILAALVLSWIGDALLLSRTNRLFLLGIASFLLSHIAFSIAFATRPLSLTGLMIAFAAMACIGTIVLKWLWSHLENFYRVAVTAYVVAIFAMCSFAVALSAASGNWILAIGALAFAASDISVARDRFVSPGFVNRVWGLPLYYAAQVTLALSVGSIAV